MKKVILAVMSAALLCQTAAFAETGAKTAGQTIAVPTSGSGGDSRASIGSGGGSSSSSHSVSSVSAILDSSDGEYTDTVTFVTNAPSDGYIYVVEFDGAKMIKAVRQSVSDFKAVKFDRTKTVKIIATQSNGITPTGLISAVIEPNTKYEGKTAVQKAWEALNIDGLSDDVITFADWSDFNVTFDDPTPTPTPPAEKEYTLTQPTVENGTVTFDKAKAKKGDTVTITATPDEGYEIGEVKVNDGAVELTDVSDGKYTFTMPDSEITVNVTFTKKQEEEKLTAKQKAQKALVADGISEENITVTDLKDWNVIFGDEPVEPPVTKHTIMVSKNGEGTAETDKTEAAKGEVVIVSIEAASGYKFDDELFYVGEKSGKVLITKDQNDGEYKFTMPDEDITITATFLQDTSQTNKTAVEKAKEALVEGGLDEDNITTAIWDADFDVTFGEAQPEAINTVFVKAIDSVTDIADSYTRIENLKKFVSQILFS